ARDATQDCFMTLLQPETRLPGTGLGPWLHRVAANRCLDRIKTARRRQAREHLYAARQPDAVRPEVPNELGRFLDESINELNHTLRTVIVEHFFEGKTHDAIASVDGVSRSAVTHRVKQAVDQLR